MVDGHRNSPSAAVVMIATPLTGVMVATMRIPAAPLVAIAAARSIATVVVTRVAVVAAALATFPL